MKKLLVKTENSKYNIIIVKNNIGMFFDELKKLKLLKTKILIVTDENVAKFHLKELIKNFKKHKLDYYYIVLPAGEKTKSFNHLKLILDKMIENDFSRDSVILAFGGGVIGDLCGFAASIYMRGIKYIQLPTTIISQVDSSVGGKTAINYKKYKNFIGTFTPPNLVFINLEFLKTLNKRNYISGFAEVLKYGFILKKSFLDYLNKNINKILNKDFKILETVIYESCKFKKLVVEEDEKENKLRMILNFGHTIGHTIEELSKYNKYLHGEAVSIGMAASLFISYKKNNISEKLFFKYLSLMEKFGLPVKVENKLSPQKQFKLLYKDKKVKDLKLNFILLEKIGKYKIVNNLDNEILQTTLIKIQNGDYLK